MRPDPLRPHGVGSNQRSYLFEKFRSNALCNPLFTLVRERLLSLYHIGQTGLDVRSLSVGCETEFFLLNRDGRGSTFEESQRFLQKFSETSHLRIEAAILANGREAITAVSRESSGGRYTKVKYEYAPHMLEVAFRHHYSLPALAREVTKLFDEMNQVARSIGLEIRLTSFVDPVSVDPYTGPSLFPKLNLINSSRIAYMRANGKVINERALFTSYMSGTQLHIGKRQWFYEPKLMTFLYSLEPVVLEINERYLAKGRVASVLQSRMELYDNAFPGFPLVGIPEFEEWTTDNWICGLLLSPRVGFDPLSDDFMGLVSQELTAGSRADWVRDLQYIRPRRFGTLEFRGDGVFGDLQSMFSSFALRLAIVAFALQTHEIELDELAKVSNRQTLKDLIPKLRQALVARSFLEEVMIEGISI